MPTNQQTYLGDGVYGEWRGADLVLWTSNGIRTTNQIVFEPEVLLGLLTYLKRTAPPEILRHVGLTREEG